jgi:hypothetical protein
MIPKNTAGHYKANAKDETQIGSQPHKPRMKQIAGQKNI